ncbi:MAG: HAMP domain-containing sensor histidine kinase [Pseudomonadota bacterium]
MGERNIDRWPKAIDDDTKGGERGTAGSGFRGALRVAGRRLGGAVPSLRHSLSGKLLVLTIAFVMLSEVLVYLPSIGRAREVYLTERLEALEVAVLALEAGEPGEIEPDLTRRLLMQAGVSSIALKNETVREFYLAQMPPQPAAIYDLRTTGPLDSIMDAFDSLLAPPGRSIMIRGDARFREGAFFEIVLPEDPLREYLRTFSRNILLLSIFISVFTAALVYISLTLFLVRPMQRITQSMVSFRDDPNDGRRIMKPTDRLDEIGIAQRELAAMQTDLRSALQQKSRLAALGTAVSKINHDLRNILASSQLISDRLAQSEDPLVIRLAPKLVGSIDRAVDLCTNTLKYGKAEEAAPRPRSFNLAALIRDVTVTAGLGEGADVGVDARLPEGAALYADPDHVFRILLNLFRNAAQALRTLPEGRERTIIVHWEETDTEQRLVISDTGPGIPDAARERLFQPFTSANRPGGTGLGLSIASDLAAAHGGSLALQKSDEAGTDFLLILPRATATPAQNT